MTAATPTRRRAWTGTSVVLLVAVVYLLPLQWMLSTSVAPSGQAPAETGHVLPRITAGDGLRAELARHPEGSVEADAAQRRLRELGAAADRPLTPLGTSWWRGAGAVARGNYRQVWTSRVADFPLYLKNTLIVSVLCYLLLPLAMDVRLGVVPAWAAPR